MKNILYINSYLKMICAKEQNGGQNDTFVFFVKITLLLSIINVKLK